MACFAFKHNSKMTKKAIITGGTKGIGLALVQKFIAEGYTVATCARNQADLDALKLRLPSIIALQADVSQKAQVQAFGKEALAQLGTPDVLINNAGVFLPGNIQTEDDGVLEKLLSTNVESAYHLTRTLLPSLVKVGKGHIVNICSTASIVPYTNGGSYCISKFALLGFSKVLREELKTTGLRVTSVLPGAVLTPSWDGMNLPSERFIDAAELADIIFSVVSTKAGTVVEELVIRPQLGDI